MLILPTEPPSELVPFLTDPTSIVVSVSGGLDSDRTALLMREQFPAHRLILWHAHLDRMDWPETASHLDRLAAFLGNTERVTVQPVYELTGGKTPTGFWSTRLRRIHDVTACGPATDDDPAAITNLIDFAERARKGMPPTKRLRYCTAYFKTAPFDSWLAKNRSALGPRCLIATGERWAESARDSKPGSGVVGWLPPADHRQAGGHFGFARSSTSKPTKSPPRSSPQGLRLTPDTLPKVPLWKAFKIGFGMNAGVRG